MSMATLAVRREALYMGEPGRQLFALFHVADHAAALDCVAVICNPIGYEYIHSHRTLRHLADDLARAGVPTLRFDYDGTGDSPGVDLDSDRLNRWIEDIEVAIAAARSLSGRGQVCLVGLRLGATLATLVASRTRVDYLVLWSPCVSGRRFVREVEALAKSTDQGVKDSDGVLEAGGFLFSLKTQQQLRALNILGQPVKVRQSALVLARDDLSENHQLEDHLRSLGIETNATTFSGYAAMMVEPQNTVIPKEALDQIISWVSRQAATHLSLVKPLPNFENAMQFSFDSIDSAATALKETVCRFGDDGCLIGIHCQPMGVTAKLPTVVLFNSGVVHRVGPNRLYIELARNLAAAGFATFRCDIEGIGDSVPRATVQENHPYPDTALRDGRITLEFLAARFSASAFVLMGLCSGAYTSFITGLNDVNAPITELALINPLTFQWREGDSLSTLHFGAVAHYKGTVRQLDSWKKLLRGEVNVLRLAEVVSQHLRTQSKSYYNAFVERWFPSRAPLLSRQLNRLFGRGRKISLFIASGDPGYDMLTAEARYTAHRALARGDLAVQLIEDADHTFTREEARSRLISAVRDHLIRRYKPS